MVACSAPAHAGHWVWTVSGSGTASTNTGRSQTWTAPTGPVTSPISIPQIVAGDGAGRQFGGGTFPPIKANASMSVTVTGTWTSDTNSDNTAPSSVLFSVQSSANGSCQNNGNPEQAGQADDGLHDPFDPNAQLPGTSDTPKVEYQPSQSGSISVSLSLSGSASGTPGLQGGGGASAAAGPITIAVHAQPYDFYQTSVTDNGDGSLTFTYGWSSTDGNLGSLGSCYLHERVTYPGGSPYIVPAPFSYPNPLPNPTVAPGTGTSGIVMTATNTNSDTQHTWTPVAPYSNATLTAQQQYEYDDVATGVSNTIVPGPGSGPFAITRTVAPRPPYAVYWWYSCTKQGTTAWLALQ